jgi:oligopeptide transport system substrate-binding protein
VGVRALDELTLTVELEGPMGYFLHLLAHYVSFPVPRQMVELHGEAWVEPENILTCGPFRLEAWDRGERIVLVRNPEYHGRFTGNLQRVEVSFLPDPSLQLEMYEADNLDIKALGGLTPLELGSARQRYAGEYISGPLLATQYVAFDASRPPFDDVRTRRAFALATDRETLAEVIMRGYVFPATGGFVPPGMPGHSTGIGLPYDPEGARLLLAEAGYPGGRGFPVVDLLARQVREAQCEYLQAQWRQNLGVEVTWETMGLGVLNDRLSNNPPYAFTLGLVADYPDPDNFLRLDGMRAMWGGLGGTSRPTTGWWRKPGESRNRESG